MRTANLDLFQPKQPIIHDWSNIFGHPEIINLLVKASRPNPTHVSIRIIGGVLIRGFANQFEHPTVIKTNFEDRLLPTHFGFSGLTLSKADTVYRDTLTKIKARNIYFLWGKTQRRPSPSDLTGQSTQAASKFIYDQVPNEFPSIITLRDYTILFDQQMMVQNKDDDSPALEIETIVANWITSDGRFIRKNGPPKIEISDYREYYRNGYKHGRKYGDAQIGWNPFFDHEDANPHVKSAFEFVRNRSGPIDPLSNHFFCSSQDEMAYLVDISDHIR